MWLSNSKIKEICKLKGITLADLLEKSGVSKTAYYHLVGKDSVLPSSVLKLSEVLEIPPSEILYDEKVQVQKTLLLREKLGRLLKDHPELDPDDAWQTLLALEKPPLERLIDGLKRSKLPTYFKKRT